MVFGKRREIPDERQDRVLIGRQPDGLIFAAMPPGPFAITFMLLAQAHETVNCGMVDSMAYHMQTEEVTQAKVVTPEILKIILDNLKSRHKTEFTDAVWKKGDADILDGMFYAELHPIDLAGIAQACKELQSTVKNSELYPSIAGIVDLWINAAERFVTPAEMVATAGYEGKA